MKILVIDTGGLAVGMTHLLAQQSNDVYYYSPWHAPYPKFEVNGGVGVGIPNVTKVSDWGSVVDDCDVVFFPDIGMGELQNYLKSKGHLVCGASLGEVLEQDRVKSIKILDSLNILHPESYVVYGFDEAIDWIASASDLSETNQVATGEYFVKFNVWRGSIDSFPIQSKKAAIQMLSNAKPKFGTYADKLPIIIQKKVDGIECGFDAWFNGNDFLSPCLWGFEYGASYLGKVTEIEDMPQQYQNFMNKIAPYLAEVGYQGSFSTEGILANDGNFYLIDACCRMPVPLGMIFPYFIDNFGELILSCAKKESIRFPLAKSFYGVLEISSTEAEDKFILLQGGDNTVFLRYMMNERREKYSVPPVAILGVALAQASTISKLKEKLDVEVEKLNVFFGSIFNVIPEMLDKFVKPFEEQLNIDFNVSENRVTWAKKLLSLF